MRFSKLFSVTYKEAPREAELKNHQLLMRAGMIHQFGSGIFGLLPLGHRIVQKIIGVTREEINRIDGQEISMSAAVPKGIWEETGRYNAIDSSMFRFQDRHGQDMVLNMTHEEPVVDLVRNVINSYKNFPFSLYQFQTKFRDEARPRGGLIRLREFIMKDAYSFHTSEDDLRITYQKYFEAYHRIFTRLGFKDFIHVASDNGMFGGNYSHEFMLLTESGEDTLLICPSCEYKANKEVASSPLAKAGSAGKGIEEIETPDQKTIDELCAFLSIKPENTAKAVLFETVDEGEPVIAFIRGDRDVLQIKLETALRKPLKAAGDKAISTAGAVAGSTGPIGLNLDKAWVVVDPSLDVDGEYCTGANKTDYHLVNFSPRRDFLDQLSDAQKERVKIIDIAEIEGGDPCKECGASLETKRGIEIGNIFHLGTKYSEAMGFTYLDQNGKSQIPIMGCYGLGITRALGSIVEEQNDEFGMKLPITIAPFELHLMAINYKKDEVKEAADKLYDELKAAGIDVLMDDRDKKPGFQFKDADLIGIPIRLVVSPKLLAENQLELSHRSDPKQKERIDIKDAVSVLKAMIADEYKKFDPDYQAEAKN
ncbi:proline--tRNA ligase [Pseudobacteriovorax antillogorgiicola]|uniref:Proline--tRNA ligase n=1 Tax=Pseudobacteriovorax antillogorgiicola TaxID=1513793 RepID=A0A1Y6C4B1_9BACT|nr:proline--tRNA ligase [Pseudobacteriovorax antillogorgiicola]TCS49902.1 prolyl-tRNA synthetase [Pseudobacteriovorax antillogorgiicola]SMF44800.1 prolyl-tRNA synthetase [Pseudobacteriovorax antillogorgiicola]